MRIWIARLLIGSVTAWNLQAAFAFIVSPAAFTRGFELSGVPGQAAVRGVGVLFLMWSVPYVAALLHPRRDGLALSLALVMQTIGLIGESFILSTLAAEHAVLRASILRFIAFDGIGLLLLIAARQLAPKAGTIDPSRVGEMPMQEAAPKNRLHPRR